MFIRIIDTYFYSPLVSIKLDLFKVSSGNVSSIYALSVNITPYYFKFSKIS